MYDQKKVSIIVCISLISLFMFYAFAYDVNKYQYSPHQDQMAALGQFGDFLGGTLNPFLALLTVIGLCYTIHLQRVQLHDAQEQNKITTKQLYLQQFESTFFNLLDLHSKITDNLTINTSILTNLFGKGYYKRTKLALIQDQYKSKDVFLIIYYVITDFIGGATNKSTNRYKEIQQSHNEILGHYFRNLYHILKTIHESAIDETQKKKYSNILRAQISTYELAILLINCIKDTVDNGEFRDLLVKYEFLEHIPFELTGKKDITIKGSILRFISFEQVKEYIPNHDLNSGAFGKNPFFDLDEVKHILTKT